MYQLSADFQQVKNLQLSTLLLRGCEMSNLGLVALCDTQSTIIELDVSSCARVTDSALSSICSRLPNLKILSIQSCRAITDTGIQGLSQLSQLESVNLQGLERITSHGQLTTLVNKNVGVKYNQTF